MIIISLWNIFYKHPSPTKNIWNFQSNDKNAPLFIYYFRYNDSTAENVKDFDIWFNSKILV